MQNINIVFEHLHENKRELYWPNGIKIGDQERFKLNFCKGNGYYPFYILRTENSENVKLFHYRELESGLLKREKYLYFIELSKPWACTEMFEYDNNFFTIPEAILSDVRNNIAKIVMLVGYEGLGFAPPRCNAIIAYIQNIINTNNLPQYGVVYIDGNVLCETYLKQFGIKGYYYNIFQSAKYYNIDYVSTEKYNEIKNNIINKITRPKKYLCFNRAPREHRSYLVEKMLKNNLIEDAIVTHCEANYYDNVGGAESTPWNYFIDVDLEYLKKFIPLVYDIQNIKNENPNKLNVSAQLQCYFNVVTETHLDQDSTRMFYSEKTFKPITCLQPFILVGQPFSLKYLKDMGFKTFSDFIDESYDETINNVERLDKIIDVVKKIYSMSQAELNDMLYNMLPILEWNYYQNIYISNSQDGKNLLNRIVSEW